MTNFRDSFLQALYYAPFRNRFINDHEVVVVWPGPTDSQFIVDFINTDINPIKSLEITVWKDLLVIGENSQTLLPLVDPTSEGTIHCLDGNILTSWRETVCKQILANTIIDYKKVRFTKLIGGKEFYYDKWFNTVEPDPLNFVLPQDINIDRLIEFATSDILQVIRGITIQWLNYAILPEWHAIGEHPYYIKMGGKKYIILRYIDSNIVLRLCLTNERECIEFNVAARCEQVDGLYDGHVLSKVNHDNITLHIGDLFLEYIMDKNYFSVSNAADPKSGYRTKSAVQLGH